MHQAEIAQGIEHAQLVAGQLHVDVQLDIRERGAREVLRLAIEISEGVSRAHVLVVVGDQQATAAVGMLAQHVELDHVHVAQCRVEARARVSRLDVRGPLVTDTARARE